MRGEAFKHIQKRPYLSYAEILARETAERVRDVRRRLAALPWHWSRHVGEEFERRGGVASAAAAEWFGKVSAAAVSRVPLSASDDDLRTAARQAARDGADVAGLAGVRSGEALRALLSDHCRRWGVTPPGVEYQDGPAMRRMVCARWWLRRLRRAHGRLCDGAAIKAGVVRRGLWAYASQDAVERREGQRRRNRRALDKAVVECAASGESLNLAEVVRGSIANPEVKRSELMVRIRGCDAIAAQNGDVGGCVTLGA